jgi:hypothetical protein
VILYRKAAPLRLRRVAAPAMPFWCATTISPYSARRASPIAIDYVALRASGAERLEVTVTESPRDELERTKVLDGPVLIDAAEAAEEVFRRGEETLAYCAEQQVAALFLTSTEGALPSASSDVVIAIAAWPLDLTVLGRLFAAAQERALPWGVCVPLLYPATTDLALLEQLADLAVQHGAAFLAPIALEIDPTAKQALATDSDDETFAMLFHSDLDPLHTATERHVAALAASRGLADFILPPRWEERSNWNAAILLTRTASRMMAMELDLDLAGTLSRSARAIAALDKPITRIAAAASLSIIGTLDDTSAEILTEWLAKGSAEFVEYVDRKWRVRRDYGVP